MSRLLIHVEGQTEETFVNEILSNHLLSRGYSVVSPRIIGNSRSRHRRGGIVPWTLARRDIINHLKEDSACLVTTMVDFYGLPQIGEAAWPGRKQSAHLAAHEKALLVEHALLEDVTTAIAERSNPSRFVPFVLVHEFEALLFSDCVSFSRGIARSDLASAFQVIRDQFPTPEDINDSPENAPSKRVRRLVPDTRSLCLVH